MELMYGDNSVLQSGYHWPERVCVTPAATTQRYQVCDTSEATCNCCDKGGDTLPFTMVLTGCTGVAGTYSFGATRYRSPDPLPTGVSYPAETPCGVFWYALDTGITCPGTGSGDSWGGGDGGTVQIGLLSWCDATTYRVEAYCYNTALETWVSQGEGTVSDYECLCNGTPQFQYTLPEVDCCCETELIVTDCCPDGIPDTLTVELSGTSCADFVTTVTWNGTTRWEGTVDICGLTMSVTVTCDTVGVPGYVISVDYFAPLGGTLAVSDPIAATCSPFEASQGSLPTFYQDLIATCCGGSAGTGTLTATE